MMLTKQGVANIENNGCNVYYYLVAFCAVYNINILAFFDDEVYESELVKVAKESA